MAQEKDEALGVRIKQRFHRKPITKDVMDVFNESDHPREESGRFASSSSGQGDLTFQDLFGYDPGKSEHQNALEERAKKFRKEHPKEAEKSEYEGEPISHNVFPAKT